MSSKVGAVTVCVPEPLAGRRDAPGAAGVEAEGSGVMRSLLEFEEVPALAFPLFLARSALATRRSLTLPSSTSRTPVYAETGSARGTPGAGREEVCPGGSKTEVGLGTVN